MLAHFPQQWCGGRWQWKTTIPLESKHTCSFLTKVVGGVAGEQPSPSKTSKCANF